MIDLDGVERDCDELILNGFGYLSPDEVSDSHSIKELITRLRQAEKDAALYREIIFLCKPVVQRGVEYGSEYQELLIGHIKKVMNGSNN